MVSGQAVSAPDPKGRQWDAAALGWGRQAGLIRTWLAAATAEMLDMAGIALGMNVLDLAAGAGGQSADVADRVGPAGSVLVTDLSPDMLAAAARTLGAAGHRNISYARADMATLDMAGAGFDAAICRLGLMFVPDVVRALRAIRRALRPGARFGAMIFAGPCANPAIGIILSIASRHAGLPSPDPCRPGGLLSLSAPGLIQRLLLEAGFDDIAASPVDAPIRAASVGDYLDFVRSSAGPVMALFAAMDPGARNAALAEMAERLSVYECAQGWQVPTGLLLAAGRA
jgi:SAM-dependent methyltransferase